jgi:menaquinone C8-methyltransferase
VQSSRAAVGHRLRTRSPLLHRIIAEELSDEFVPTSAWTYSRDVDAMIDEYIVDYGEYVGIGSGALFPSSTAGCTATPSRSPSTRAAISAGRMSVAKEGVPYSKKPDVSLPVRHRPVRLRLDKERFLRDFGVPADKGARSRAYLHARSRRGIAETTDRYVTLTEKGRYLLMVIMRETLAASNDLRDKAREELPATRTHAPTRR